MQTGPDLLHQRTGRHLLDHFQKALKYTRYFDIMFGYFRTNGLYNLYEAFESIEKIRILVGLNVDRQAFALIDTWQSHQSIDFTSHKRARGLKPRRQEQ